MPEPSLLGEFFADHPGPASRQACLEALAQRYRISSARAGEWLEHALEQGRLCETDTGISPRDLSAAEAVAHVLAEHCGGLSWAEIAKAVAARGLSPGRLARTAAQKNDRVVACGSGTFRHRRFADLGAGVGAPLVVSEAGSQAVAPREQAEPPRATRPATRSAASAPRPSARKARTPRTPAPEPAPAPTPPPERSMPIVRRRASSTETPAAIDPDLDRILRELGRIISTSTRAIETQALRQRLFEDTAIDLGIDTLRALLARHAAAQGWQVRGPFVSWREIPWPDLDTVVTSAAEGRRRDPAELVARLRRLLRITDSTARALRLKLQRRPAA